eukprot:TRINITY_DN3490_c0_g6_i1.p1 TRINITY_DN3490_c0_g6~~TRINITY_DN3490_c0_g6_i1.p1  ORF type:complete len:1891 (+),score=244.04 TRINITY_DN3490_c0_g6_i1:141-5813(+)
MDKRTPSKSSTTGRHRGHNLLTCGEAERDANPRWNSKSSTGDSVTRVGSKRNTKGGCRFAQTHEINVESATGRRIRFQSHGIDTVRKLQERVQALLHVSPSRQLLSNTKLQLEPELRDDSNGGVGGVTVRERQLKEFGLPPIATLRLTNFTELRPHRGEFCPIIGTENRAMTLSQLDKLLLFIRRQCDGAGRIPAWRDLSRDSPTFGEVLRYKEMNLYHCADWIIKPATYEHRCSFVELIASDARRQKPTWFVSHWWGEGVVRFVESVRTHKETRGVCDNSAYWVCAYSNNQHDLGAEVVSNPAETSFMKAMRNCVGVLLVLDDQATPFSRVWCCYEEALAVTPDPETDKNWILLDIATTSKEERGVVITDGLTKDEEREEAKQGGLGWRKKAEREQCFPTEIIDKALNVDIEQANASREMDKRRILNSIARRDKQLLDEEPLRSHESYRRVNVQLRGILALAGWLGVVNRSGAVLDKVERKRILTRFRNALRDDAGRTECNLSFFGCQSFGIQEIMDLADGLPSRLRVLMLNLGNCKCFDTACLVFLAKALPNTLERMNLDLFRCDLISDEGLASLARYLPTSLVCLRLNFRRCAISCMGLLALADRLPATLTILELIFVSCEQVRDRGFLGLAAALPRGLSHLHLDFCSCSLIGNEGLRGLAKHLPSRLENLELNFMETGITSDGLSALVRTLPVCLQKLRLDVDSSGRLLEHFVELVHGRPLWYVQRWQRTLLADHAMTSVGLSTLPAESSHDSVAEERSLRANDAKAATLASRLTSENILESCGAAGALAALGRNDSRWRSDETSRSAFVQYADLLQNLLSSKYRLLQRASMEAMDSLGLWAAAAPRVVVLVELLSDEDKEVQMKAISFLARLGEDAASHVSDLAALLTDKDLNARIAAVGAVSQLGDAAGPYVSKVCDCLYEEDFELRCAAGKALLELPPKFASVHFPSLAAALDHRDLTVRNRIDVALNSIGERRCGAALVAVLDHKHWQVRKAAARMLGNLGYAALPHKTALEELLVDEKTDWRVWAAALDTLERIGVRQRISVQVLVQRLASEHEEVRRLACTLFLELPESDTLIHTPSLTTVLGDDDVAIRKQASARLRKLGERQRVDALIAALKNKDPKVRRGAAMALRHVTTAVAASCKSLIGHLEDGIGDCECPNRSVGELAAESLVDIGALAVPHLSDALDDHRLGLGQRLQVARVIKLIGPTAAGVRSADALAECLDDTSYRMRLQAVEVLGCFGGIALHHATAIAARVNDEDPDVRVAAVKALRCIGNEACSSNVELLAAKLEDEDDEMREAAVEAFACLVREDRFCHIAEPHAGVVTERLADTRVGVRRAARTVLGGIGPSVANHLVRLLPRDVSACNCQAPSERIANAAARLAAAEILGELDPSVMGQHAAALLERAATDSDSRVREAASAALVTAGPIVLQRVLEQVCDEEHRRGHGIVTKLRVAALDAFGRCGVEAAPYAESVSKLVDSGPRMVRAAALEALSSIHAPEFAMVFLEHFHDEEIEIRLACIAGLGMTGPAGLEHAHVLVGCLASFHTSIRLAATDALVQLGSEVARHVAQRMDDQDPRSRVLATEVLGRLGLGDLGAQKAMPYVNLVAKHLRDVDKDVRLAAVKACVALGPLACFCVEVLRACTEDEVESVRHAAATAIEEILTNDQSTDSHMPGKAGQVSQTQAGHPAKWIENSPSSSRHESMSCTSPVAISTTSLSPSRCSSASTIASSQTSFRTSTVSMSMSPKHITASSGLGNERRTMRPPGSNSTAVAVKSDTVRRSASFIGVSDIQRSTVSRSRRDDTIGSGDGNIMFASREGTCLSSSKSACSLTASRNKSRSPPRSVLPRIGLEQQSAPSLNSQRTTKAPAGNGNGRYSLTRNQ